MILGSFNSNMTLKTESCRNANFVVNGGTLGATSDDKVGIMATLSFPWRLTTSVNCCNRTFYCNDNKITEFDILPLSTVAIEHSIVMTTKLRSLI